MDLLVLSTLRNLDVKRRLKESNLWNVTGAFLLLFLVLEGELADDFASVTGLKKHVNLVLLAN